MSKLDEILAMKRREVEAAQARRPEADLRAQLPDLDPPRGFLRALEAFPGIGLIAEVKKASPSEGVIRADFDPAEILRSRGDRIDLPTSRCPMPERVDRSTLLSGRTGKPEACP